MVVDHAVGGIIMGHQGQVPPAPLATPATPATPLDMAFTDLIDGARLTHLWVRLGWQDIRRRYRRSVLGPLWLTISMGLMVALLGTLYGRIFKVGAADYLPYLTLGFVIWGLVNGLTTDGCTALVNARNIIQQVRLPLSVHVYRVVWSNLIVFCHNALTLFVRYRSRVGHWI